MLALKLQQLVYGAEASNADIADTLYNLGVAWTSLRGHQAAQSYLEQALQMREYIHGKDSINREIAAILNSLGLLELRNGKQQSASNYFERALEMYRKFYGANEHNIDIAVVVSNRGTILDFEYASCVYDEIYGRDGCTEERIFALSKMGLACAILYKPQEAIAYCEQAYTIIAKVNMEEVNVVNVAEALDMLGHAWSTLKKYTLALECFEKALTFKRQFYGISASNERVAKTISSIGAVSFELGEIQKALTITEQALVMYRLVQGEDADTLEIASCLVILGRCLARSEETLKAIALFLQALRIQLQYSGEANLKSLAFTLNQIGNTFLVLGGSQEALYYLQQALQAYCKLNIEHYRENIIEITDKLYGLWSAISDKQYIINYLEIARTAISKGPWDDIGFVAEAKIAMNLGCAYLEVGNNQKAAMYGEIALRLTQKVYG